MSYFQTLSIHEKKKKPESKARILSRCNCIYLKQIIRHPYREICVSYKKLRPSELLRIVGTSDLQIVLDLAKAGIFSEPNEYGKCETSSQ